ncbi:hypothetical protein D3C71_1205620 [compost metagenome]
MATGMKKALVAIRGLCCFCRFFPTRCIHEKIAEVARAFAALHGAAQVGNEILILRRVGHVQNEASMAAVLVILAPEQGRRLVQQRALQSRQPLR